MIYDLIVLGGGPAGYTASERAGSAGLKVLLIEKEAVGGVCLNHGCIPTKTLLYSAKIKETAEHGRKYGVDVNEIQLNHSFVLKRKNKIVKKLTIGIKNQLKAAGVEFISGEGVISGKSEAGFKVLVDDVAYIGRRLLLATGSSPIIPDIMGIDESVESGYAMTSRELLDLKVIPENLVVIGGGVIGLEMASYFNCAGSDVTVIEMLNKIGGNVDDEIAALLKKEYEKKGIKFLLESKVVKVHDNSVIYNQNGIEGEIKTDKVLISVGRNPNTRKIGLDSISVEVSEGGIMVDSNCMTNVEGVYSAGDATGRSMLAHIAYRQAEAAINHMLDRDDEMSYKAIPSVIYTNPEVASVGHTKKSADKHGIDTVEKTLPMNYSGRYMAENERGEGIIKIVVNRTTNTLMGVHMIGNYSSEIIASAGIMVEKNMTLDEIKRLVFPHPTVSEIIREAIFLSDF